MAIVVQKFGGTSVKTIENRQEVLKCIIKAKKQGYDVVVVVSAMGRSGDPYATDTLLDLIKANKVKISAKKKDLIMSCGEVISAVIMASYIEENGLESEALTGFQAGIETNDEFGNADILTINTKQIEDKIKDGKVVVIAGFQGVTKNNEITTLGRGGSDTTAVVLGGFLKAEKVEIFTDVPGIALTDPRIVPDTKFISNLSYDEVIIMADNGAKVIHPRAVRAAKQFNIPLYIKSTFSDENGTLINNANSSLEVAGVTLEENLCIISFNEGIDKEGILKKLCTNNYIMFENSEKALVVDGSCREEIENLSNQIIIHKDMSKVSIIHNNVKSENIINYMITLFANNNIPIVAYKYMHNCSNFIIPNNYGKESLQTIYYNIFRK